MKISRPVFLSFFFTLLPLLISGQTYPTTLFADAGTSGKIVTISEHGTLLALSDNLLIIPNQYMIPLNKSSMLNITEIFQAPPYKNHLLGNNNIMFPEAKPERTPSVHSILEVERKTLPISPYFLPVSESTRKKVSNPNGTIIGVGAAFIIGGAAYILAKPVPDFSDETQEKDQNKFVIASCAIFSGTLALIIGLTERTPVIYPAKLPDESATRMILTSNAENSRVKSDIAEILNEGKTRVHDKGAKITGVPDKVTAYDDRIEMLIKGKKSVLDFQNLYVNGVSVYEEINKKIAIDQIVFKGDDQNNRFDEFVAELKYIRSQLKKQLDDQEYATKLDAFKPIAASYRSMDEKPELSENQRKMIIQANLYREKEQFVDAIKSLNAVQDENPISYPQGYANMAFLFERMNSYHDAILNMKKYLLLEPFADDARQSQNKIYEWELLLDKQIID